MANLRKLNLPTVYEELVQSLNEELTKMMQFVVPVETAEQELAIITNSMKYSGKVVFLLGEPGIGKSTFIQSLTWRKFLPIPQIREINAHELGKRSERFERLFYELSLIANRAKQDQLGMITVVINYLEDFSGYEENHVRALFRDINGLLRNNLMLIIWPVTEKDEAQKMLTLASAVSGTVFAEKPILKFSGPPQEKFPTIAKNTIATLNEGLSFDDFQLSDQDFEDLLNVLNNNKPKKERTIRDYLNLVKREWEDRSNVIQDIVDKIPRFTEIWFVICYPEAENTVNQFARKSTDPDLAWNGDIRKFSEYLTGQKAEYWDQRRLIYALQGFFKTKILFLPTNALVSCVAAFGSEKEHKFGVETQNIDQLFLEKIHSRIPSQEWRKKWKAGRFLDRTPMVQQLKEEEAILGGRRGKSSLKNAENAFAEINQYISSGGEGSDQPINKSLAAGLRYALKDYDLDISAEKLHPWLEKIRPDILIKKKDKIICIEMHYTADTRAYVLANYVLTKLDVYMRQLDAYMEKPRLIPDY